ncbi:MAG TPA: RluA family pseudouridine synthase [Blastocatellia bacterium]|nr:RluA family pseudouridine synthase [Blastocatellia bacterium]
MSEEATYLSVPAEAAGSRIDSYLATSLVEASRTRIQRALEDGDILVNDRVVKPSYRLRAGDRIEVDLPEPPPSQLIPEPIPIKVVYEDDDLIVVDKPAGMVVHPGAGIPTGTLANALVYHFQELSGSSGSLRPGIVHRIDKETSGLMVVAKNDRAHELLSEQFRMRQVFKMYIALVHGRVSTAAGEIIGRIGRSPHNRTRMAVLRGSAGREAITAFEVAERFSQFTLLKVQIKTGRTHQIRVHMAHIGHPVVGDDVYGSGRVKTVQSSQVRREIQNLGRHFLHSGQLGFVHPGSGKRIELMSELPEDLVGILAGLR